jgi:hypothetical protein
MKTRADYLRELDLGENATAAEIREAYRDLAKVWHPDRFPNDPRMQGKATDKLRRVIEAYEYLQAHPRRSQPRPRATAAHEQGARQPRASQRPPSRQAQLRQALATLERRVELLEKKVAEVNKRGVTRWEHRAWIGIACGMGIPVAVVFLAGQAVRPIGVPLYFIFVGSCLSVFALALYRGLRLYEHTRDEIEAIGKADVTCGSCDRRVAGLVLPSRAHEVLARAGWAHAHLKCPHCRRAFA